MRKKSIFLLLVVLVLHELNSSANEVKESHPTSISYLTKSSTIIKRSLPSTGQVINYLRNKRNADEDGQYNPKLSDDSKILELKNKIFDIEIHPRVTNIDSSSVTLEWDALVNRTEHFSMSDVALKISFRPFGSISEREVTLLMKTNDYSSNFEVSSEYVIDHLVPNTGYILCFSIVTFSYDKVDEEKEEQVKFSISEDHPVEEEKVFINNFQGINPFSSFEQGSFFSRGDVYKEDYESFPLSYPLTSTTTDRGEPLHRQGNYAYTSTGELIYLPSTQWTPQKRTKRATNRGDVSKVVHEKDKFCQEIVTKYHFSSFMSPFNILIASIAFFGVIAITIFLIFIFCKKKYFMKQKQSLSHSNSMATTTELKAAEDSSLRKSSIKEIANCKPIASESNDLSIKPSHSKLPVRKPIESDFHPGYEIPPSSTNEAYGYDFPKASNKVATSPNACESFSKCNFDYINSEFSWDAISNKYNIDLPPRKNKKSEANKIVMHKNLPSQKYLTIHSLKARKVDHHTTEAGEPPSYDTFQQSEYLSDDNNFDTNDIKIAKNQSVGDIIVTGGTLIEVPEGYAKPVKHPRSILPMDRDAVLRIMIGGEPSYV